MADLTVASFEEMELIYDGLARRGRATLRVSAFGMQVMSLPPNWDGYPKHRHDGSYAITRPSRASSSNAPDHISAEPSASVDAEDRCALAVLLVVEPDAVDAGLGHDASLIAPGRSVGRAVQARRSGATACGLGSNAACRRSAAERHSTPSETGRQGCVDMAVDVTCELTIPRPRA